MSKNIFVAIASYRDPECQHTVQDLFARATHPERINVGICWQFDPKEDLDCFQVKSPFPEQMRISSHHWRESKGGCWARAQALSLVEDEDFILQIDAHMRFVDGWDEILLDVYARCPTKPAVISTMPPDYHPPRRLQATEGSVTVTRVRRVARADELQPLSLGAYIRKNENLHTKGPIISPFIVGNFMFAPAEIIRAVPYDPHIYFRGQELTYSTRLWTHGYDVYQPDQVLIYHYWESKPRLSAEAADYKEAKNDPSLRARERVWHVLGIEKAKDSQSLIDIGKYGMGNKRKLEDFWDFAGINMRTRKVDEKAIQGTWTPYKG